MKRATAILFSLLLWPCCKSQEKIFSQNVHTSIVTGKKITIPSIPAPHNYAAHLKLLSEGQTTVVQGQSICLPTSPEHSCWRQSMSLFCADGSLFRPFLGHHISSPLEPIKDAWVSQVRLSTNWYNLSKVWFFSVLESNCSCLRFIQIQMYPVPACQNNPN